MRILGVTLGWDARPTLAFTFDGKDMRVFPRGREMQRHAHYYPDGLGSWPRDPETGEKLPIADPTDCAT